MNRALAATALVLIASCSLTRADQTYSESTSGDLSDNRLAPTTLTLTRGSNRIIGTFGPSPVLDVPDLDYLSISIPSGLSLTAITLDAASVGGAVSFLGIQTGPQLTLDPFSGIATGLLGWTHFGSGDIGTDMLPALGAGPGALGFVPPLSSGTYTLWIMELDMSAPHTFAFNLVLELSCRADFDASGSLTLQDIFDFLNAWFASSPTADINGNGLSTTDIFDFLNTWFAGC